MEEFTKQYEGPFNVGDLVACDYFNMDGWRSEWVGKVIKTTETQVHVQRVLSTVIEKAFSGTESSTSSVVDVDAKLIDDIVLFRWAKSQGWYQTAGPGARYFISGLYKSGQILSSQSYY